MAPHVPVYNALWSEPHTNSIAISSFISAFQLLGVSWLAISLALRLRFQDFKSFHGLRQINLPRLFLVLLFASAWLFFVITTVVLQGIGINANRSMCTTGIFFCIGLYGVAKLFTYLFLSERAHIVHNAATPRARWKSPMYILCIVVMLLYGGIICHLFIVHIAYIREDGVCMIGIAMDGVIMIVVFDVIVSILLTSLFVSPLVRARTRGAQLRRTARRSITAAAIVLITSAGNISVLAAMHGKERGWLLLITWEGDVLIGAAAFFWLTRGSGLRPSASFMHRVRGWPHENPQEKRGWLPRAFSFYHHRAAQPEHSLPALYTHGALSEDSTSSLQSTASLALPDPVASVGWTPSPRVYARGSVSLPCLLQPQAGLEVVEKKSSPYSL